METIKAALIIEMIGKPKDYLNETLSKFVDRISLDKGVKIVGKKINEAKKIEKSDLFSSFAEVDVELEGGMHQLINLIFAYMPAHVEVISPEEVRLKNFELNTLCNDLTRKLLAYDDIAKQFMYANKVLEAQLRQNGIEPAITQKNPEEQKAEREKDKTPIKKEKKAKKKRKK